MKIKIFGSRGSVPISNSGSISMGGNTTCIRIYDDSIPEDMALIVDAGTGFLPMGQEIMERNKMKDIQILFTHYHHDHTMGLFLSPLTFIKKFNIDLFGPLENGVGCKEMMEHLMHKPYFPVDVKEVRSHFSYAGISSISSKVILIHKQGTRLIDIDHYETLLKFEEYFPIGKGKYPIEEFIVIKMHKTRHPEKTISYRFENKKDGKIFVFLTDHENGDGVSNSMQEHIKDADVLVMDCQYSREKYDAGAVGFGHGTPNYCVKLAEMCNVKKLGLTHHDPSSTDADVWDIVREAIDCKTSPALEIFPCSDYLEINI